MEHTIIKALLVFEGTKCISCIITPEEKAKLKGKSGINENSKIAENICVKLAPEE